MELRILFEKLKTCSLCLKNILEKEDYDQLDSILDERQGILDAIKELSFTKEEISKVVEELEITELSKKIHALIELKKNCLKTEFENISVKKDANTKYNSNFYNNSHIFSKKV